MSCARHVAELMQLAGWVQCAGHTGTPQLAVNENSKRLLHTADRDLQDALTAQLPSTCRPALYQADVSSVRPTLFGSCSSRLKQGRHQILALTAAACVPSSMHVLIGALHVCSWSADYRRLVSPSRKSFAETYGEQCHATLYLTL